MAIELNIQSQIQEYLNQAAFPATGSAKTIYVAKDTNLLYRWDGTDYVQVSAQTATLWGSIDGVLSNQTDLQSALDDKVDVIAGKGLSTNDYTNTEKSKLAGIQAGAEVNVNADWNATSGDAQILNKPDLSTYATDSELTSGLATKEDAISAATTADYFRGDKTFQPLNKSAVGLSNVDNTSDADKPVSSATQTALNNKQNAITLTTTGTSGAATLVGDTLNIPQYSGGSGGGNVGIHALLPLASGQTVTAAINAISITPTTTVLNRLYANVFIPNQNITTSSLRINCATAAAGGLAKIFIYSDNNGSPDSLLYGSSDLDLSTTGIKTATTTFNFVAGTRYWIGAHLNNATSQLSFLAIGQLTPLYNTTISTSAGIVIATVNYASGLPSTFPSPTFGTSGAPVIGITKA